MKNLTLWTSKPPKSSPCWWWFSTLSLCCSLLSPFIPSMPPKLDFKNPRKYVYYCYRWLPWTTWPMYPTSFWWHLHVCDTMLVTFWRIRHGFNRIFYIWAPFFLFVGMIFLQYFVDFVKMCSPPKQEAHFRKPIFANIVCKVTVPCPKWLQNHHFGRGISVLCCSKNNSFRRLNGKWPSWEAFFNIACIFACILDQIFKFLVLILPLLLGSSV